MLLAIIGVSHSQAQSPDLFGDGGEQTTVELPNPTDLSSDWYEYLSEAEPDARQQTANELFEHVEQQAAAIPDADIQANLAQNLSALKQALRTWVSLKTEVESPVVLPVTDGNDVSLSAYLQLGDNRQQTREKISTVEQRLEDIQRETRELTINLDNIARDYRTADITSPARFKLGVQRMTNRMYMLNAELDKQRTEADLKRLQNRVTAQARALAELAGKLKPQTELDVPSLDCPETESVQQLANLLDEATALNQNSCQVIADLLTKWQQLADDSLVSKRVLENIESRRQQIAKIKSRIPALRALLERQLLAQAAESADSANLSLEQLRTGIEQLNEANNRISRADLMLEVIDLQKIQGASGLVRLGYKVKSFVVDAWDTAYSVLKFRLVAIGDSIVTPLSILRVIFIVWLGWWISRLFRGSIGRFSRYRYAGGESAAWYTLSRIGHYIIIIAALLIGLASIGLDLSNLAIIAGALSVGIGFGLQSIVSNFVSGLILLFERSIKIGDYIDLEGGITGQVKAINTRFTRINTNDNIDILVPNSELVSNRLINWTMHEAMRRLHIPFGVAYGTDKELVKKAALEAAENVSYTVKDYPNREPEVWLIEFGDSSLNFELLVWLRDGVKRPTRVLAAYLWELETALRIYGIEIPFPQRDLHLRSGFEKPYFDDSAKPGENDANVDKGPPGELETAEPESTDKDAV